MIASVPPKPSGYDAPPLEGSRHLNECTPQRVFVCLRPSVAFASMPPTRTRDPYVPTQNLHAPPFSHSGRERREREQRERQQKLHYKVEVLPQVTKCLFGRHPSEYLEPLFFEYMANITKVDPITKVHSDITRGHSNPTTKFIQT